MLQTLVIDKKTLLNLLRGNPPEPKNLCRTKDYHWYLRLNYQTKPQDHDPKLFRLHLIIPIHDLGII